MKEKTIIPGDYANWVSATYYPFPEDFINEAERLGISRRVAYIPKDFVFGISRVFFVHPRAIYDKKNKKFIPGIIGFSIIPSVDLIVPDEIYDNIRKELKDKIKIVHILSASHLQEAKRGCGYRFTGMYVVAYVDANLNEYAKKYKSVKELRGSFFVLKNPIPWKYGKFIGLKKINPEEFGFEPHKPITKKEFEARHIDVNSIKRDLNKYIARLKFAKSLNYYNKRKKLTDKKIKELLDKYGLDRDDVADLLDTMS